MTNLTGKIAIVTGGSRGIGLAILNALQAAGATVANVSRSSTGPGDLYLSCDLSRYEARGEVIKRVIANFGGLDILVNSAGAQAFDPAAEYKPGQWERDLQLMLSAPFDLCQQAYPYLKGHGRIINIASVVSFQGARNCVGYVAAKHGLIGLTRSLSNEWARDGITVNAVAPGYIATDMLQPLTGNVEHSAAMLGRIPAGKFGQPDDVAGAALYLCGADYVTGSTVFVDGGWLSR